jgi:hypothetical protein
MRKKLLFVALVLVIIVNVKTTAIAKEKDTTKNNHRVAGVSKLLYKPSSTASKVKTEVVYSKDITYIYDAPREDANMVGYYMFNNSIEVIPSVDGYYQVEHDDGHTAYIKASDTLKVACGYTEKPIFRNNYFKSFMGHKTFGAKSNQYRLQCVAQTDVNGLRTVNGRYCVALGTYYTSNIGQYFDLVLANGVTIPCVLGDVKADAHTDATNTYTRFNGCMSEFIVDRRWLNPVIKQSGNVSSLFETWDSPIVKVIVYDYDCLN